MLYKWNNKAWMTAHLLTTWLLNILSPPLRPTAQKKRFISKYEHLVTQELWWRGTMRFMLFSCLLTQHPLCSPWIKESFWLSSHCLRYTFCKAIAAIHSDLRRLTLILKDVLLWVKCYQTSLHATRNRSWKEESVDVATSLLSFFFL